jgi:hypothetical protein
MQLSVLAFIRSLEGSETTENYHPSELPPRILGLNRGAMKMSDDFDEPLPDEFGLGEEGDPFVGVTSPLGESLANCSISSRKNDFSHCR